MAAMFWILAKNKDSDGSRLIPFKLNKIQKHIISVLAVLNLLVKPRQIGGTTFFSLYRLILPAIIEGGIGCQLISQSSEYAQKHFEVIRRADRYMAMVDPANSEVNQLNRALKANLLHTAYSNRKELIYDQLDSRIMVATAEVEESGQGVTLHHILADEYSRWPGNPEATLNNVRGALVTGGTVDKQCTANGAAGPFYEDVLRALADAKKSDAKLHFYPWYWADDCMLDWSPEQFKELEADLQEDELKLIFKIHKELEPVAYV